VVSQRVREGDLGHTAVILEQRGVQNLAATIPADPPESASRRLAVLSLPRIDVGEGARREIEVRTVLGEGGMGVVHLAEQAALGREVAVKVLRQRLADDAGAAWLLIDEARITGALEHPNVVPIHALGVDDGGRPVMVMKRLTGKNWRDIMCDESRTLRDGTRDLLSSNLETLMQVCNAVQFAHSRGIIHRDIKPENVMVGDHGEVYLLDWGAALELRDGLTSTAIVGTLAYMAPEMLQGTGPHITARTDVYLLGATLHEVLTGEAPHAAQDVQQALFSICRSEEPRYPERVPRELADLCRRALSRDPEARPESAHAFRHALADFLRHRGSVNMALAATQRLTQLASLGGGREAVSEERAAEVNRLFIECAFGYRQALEAWTHNQQARAGLQEAIEHMIRFELSRRNAEAAASLLHQLESPRDDLRVVVEELRRELEAEGRELQRLRQVAKQQDPSIASSARASSAIVTGVALFVIFVLLAQRYPGAVGLTHRTIAVVTLILGVAIGAGTALSREKVLGNEINRNLTAAVFAIVLTCLAIHATGMLTSAPIPYALIGDLLVSGAVVATAGFGIHRGLVVVGAIYLAGAVGAALVPARVLEALAVTFLLAHLALAWTWRALARWR
jgi:serine/threonine-protein kinase